MFSKSADMCLHCRYVLPCLNDTMKLDMLTMFVEESLQCQWVFTMSVNVYNVNEHVYNVNGYVYNVNEYDYNVNEHVYSVSVYKVNEHVYNFNE